MGYDMYVIAEPDAEEAAAVDAAQKAFNEAVQHRNQLPRGSAAADAARDQVEAAYREEDRARKSYFRLNIHGMCLALDIMASAGMIKEGRPADGDWPQLPAELSKFEDAIYEAFDRGTGADLRGTEGWQKEYGALGITDEQWAAAKAYADDRIRYLTAHDRDTPGISAHKFGSNDGWIVTPFEIEWALKAWDGKTDAERAALMGDRAEWFTRWIDWLRIAQQRGGFRVR